MEKVTAISKNNIYIAHEWSYSHSFWPRSITIFSCLAERKNMEFAMNSQRQETRPDPFLPICRIWQLFHKLFIVWIWYYYSLDYDCVTIEYCSLCLICHYQITAMINSIWQNCQCVSCLQQRNKVSTLTTRYSMRNKRWDS